jgi:starvation-inducible DNA-binding protein
MLREESFMGNVGSHIGINKADRKEISEGLGRLLADTYFLYFKTHAFHWNVTGPHFNSLHEMFMVQYTELWNAIDVIAERIRSLGHLAPGSYQELAELSSVKDAKGHLKAKVMVKELAEGHETVARTIREIFPLAEKANDESSLDVLTQRLQVHEKTAWMLRAFLDD